MESGGHRACAKALMSEINFSIHPSDAYQTWFDTLYLHRTSIQSALTTKGARLPILDEISIEAHFYRDVDRGDALGYEQALADAMQADQWKCGNCKKKTIILANCPHCRGSIAAMTHSRKGLGIIGDDAQVVHWDGSRLHKDAARPRIEVVIRTLTAPQASLFERMEEVMA